MRPQLQEIILVLEGLARRFADALEDLGQISQVINIVGLGRSRQQLFRGLDFGIELNGRSHDVLFHIGYSFGQGLGQGQEVPLKDVAEYLVEGLSVKRLDIDQVVMTKVPHGDHVPASNWREHCSDKAYTAEVFELLSIEVIPSPVVHPLPEQLDGRLCPILLLLRHVQVIDENNYLIFPLLRPEESFPPPSAYFRVDQPLNLVNHSLTGKRSSQERVLLVVIVHV